MEIAYDNAWERSEFLRAYMQGSENPIKVVVANVLVIAFGVLAISAGVVFGGLALIGITALAELYLFVMVPRRIWSMGPHMNETHHVNVSDEGITSVGPSSSIKIPWTYFKTSNETSNYYILRVRQTPSMIVKKSVLDEAETEATFRALLRAHTKASLKTNVALDHLIN